MTNEHISAVLDLYEAHMKLRAYSFQSPTLMTMFPLMRKMLEKPADREKLMRWLGFMQGALWADKSFTIDEMRDHNRAGGSLDPNATRAGE